VEPFLTTIALFTPDVFSADAVSIVVTRLLWVRHTKRVARTSFSKFKPAMRLDGAVFVLCEASVPPLVGELEVHQVQQDDSAASRGCRTVVWELDRYGPIDRVELHRNVR